MSSDYRQQVPSSEVDALAGQCLQRLDSVVSALGSTTVETTSNPCVRLTPIGFKQFGS